MTPQSTKNSNKNATPKRLIFILLGLVFILVIIILAIAPFLFRKAGKDATIRIPAHATTAMVQDSLSKYLGNSFASSTIKLTRLLSADFSKRHGAYLIAQGSNPIRAARTLTSGAQKPVRITINGFRDRNLMIDKISAKLDFPADSLREVLCDPSLLSEYDLTPDNAMSLFLNDSYDLYWSASPRDVVKKIGDNYRKFWNDSRVEKARQLGLTPSQLTIVASITDEESNALDEKGTIGRLYINRLNKGMKLQADPTVRFAVGDFTIKRVKSEHLKTDSPYNTYRINGLPPGPIRTTSAQTLDAILEAPPHPYLYMCAKEDFSGRHNFAETFQEHSANAARYRKVLNERGIK